MPTPPNTFFDRIKQALALMAGTDSDNASPSPTPSADDRLTLSSRIQALEMDLEERDRQIAKMRQDFEIQRQQAESDRSGAGAAELTALAKRLAPYLCQIPTMRSLNDEGKEVRAADLFTLFGKLEKVLAEAKIRAIGTVGDVAPFDPRLHQRMSGSDISDGNLVRVRFVGYFFGDTILTKAMVSREA